MKLTTRLNINNNHILNKKIIKKIKYKRLYDYLSKIKTIIHLNMITDINILNGISHDIIGSAFAVRNMYGNMMLESFYEKVMQIELAMKGYNVEQQVPLTIKHKNIEIENAYFADTIINNSIVIEYKAIKYLQGIEFRQLITYMKLTGIKLGFVINFGAENFTPCVYKPGKASYTAGIYRVIN